MNKQQLPNLSKIALIACLLFYLPCLSNGWIARAQNVDNVKAPEITIPVTVQAVNERMKKDAESLQPGDFIVREEKKQQQIISVKRPSETPLIVEVLIQDNLVSHVGNEIKGIKDFINNLPTGSRVMVGYLTDGALQVTQDFTVDHEKAAEATRIPMGSIYAAPYFLYSQMIDAIQRFDDQPLGRRIMLVISDGLDTSRGFREASPSLSFDLTHAITVAQRKGVAIYSFYAPSVGLTSRNYLASTYGQGCLNLLSDQTGGEAFFAGFDFVSFDPYFKEFNNMLANQWLITYRSDNSGTGFRRIEVRTEFNIHLNYPAGYTPNKE